VDRTNIRGIAAVGVVGAAMAIVAVAPAIASGSEDAKTAVTPITTASQEAAMHWDLPLVPGLRHLHKKQQQAKHRQQVARRHARERASRASYRRALSSSPQTAAHAMLLRRGWDETQWNCLDVLWTRESNWNTYATNRSSGAYGIPQALPGYKMASAGSDWRTNPITQITWGLGYIASTYGSPCAALSHSSSYGYY
jgi:hypothetical protein